MCLVRCCCSIHECCCWFVICGDMCKIHTHSSNTHTWTSSIFGFLVCYFIHFHRAHTHQITFVKLSIFFAVVALFIFVSSERIIRVRYVRCMHYCFFNQNPKDFPPKIQCSAFPIFITVLCTASQPAQYTLLFYVQNAKSGNG